MPRTTPSSQNSSASSNILLKLRLSKSPKRSARRPSTKRQLRACSRPILYVYPSKCSSERNLILICSPTISKSAPSLLRELLKSELRPCSSRLTARSVSWETLLRRALQTSRETRSRSKCVAARERARGEFYKHILLTEELPNCCAMPASERQCRSSRVAAAQHTRSFLVRKLNHIQ